MGVLVRALLLILLPALCFAWTLSSDNGTNHLKYEIIGEPFGHGIFHSSGIHAGATYQYRVVVTDNETEPVIVKWAKKRYSDPATDYGDNTTDVKLSSSGNATIDDGFFFDLGNATGYGQNATIIVERKTQGHLEIPMVLGKKNSSGLLRLRAIGDNGTTSIWVHLSWFRDADGNYTQQETGNATSEMIPTANEINRFWTTFFGVK